MVTLKKEWVLGSRPTETEWLRKHRDLLKWFQHRAADIIVFRSDHFVTEKNDILKAAQVVAASIDEMTTNLWKLSESVADQLMDLVVSINQLKKVIDMLPIRD